MRTKRIAILAFLAAITYSMAFAQSSFFNKYKDAKGVNYLFVSKAMMNLPPSSFSMNSNIRKVASKLNAIYVLQANKSKMKAVGKDFESYVKSSHFEQLMLQRRNTSTKVVYAIRGKGGIIKELLIKNLEATRIKVTLLQGDMTLSEIQAITQKNTSLNIGNMEGVFNEVPDFEEQYMDPYNFNSDDDNDKGDVIKGGGDENNDEYEDKPYSELGNKANKNGNQKVFKFNGNPNKQDNTLKLWPYLLEA